LSLNVTNSQHGPGTYSTFLLPNVHIDPISRTLSDFFSPLAPAPVLALATTSRVQQSSRNKPVVHFSKTRKDPHRLRRNRKMKRLLGLNLEKSRNQTTGIEIEPRRGGRGKGMIMLMCVFCVRLGFEKRV